MTDANPHRATPDQWAQIANLSTDPVFVVASCVEELRARIEALEANSSLPFTNPSHSVKSEPLLVQRVVMVIGRDGEQARWHEARAAILEIATWLEEEFGPQIDWMTTELRQETER